ncbi:uncharacterized protein SPPG_02753 [Spizellomyces punctatus DAOM BR117]|uniref:Rhodanese domain-containing protein n=1 Tax=Spizellomyces punctatus (strain DAOM BR117) TaxID=645134 RepID=A0A0L0HN92_SPIPD|nr:uncharacterized protein SPPG_02753 [Spizellomyces punctatus DAOM BR117]KND02274.1 hypothetical protein SPPG_02753 [Spizellomyces punctatus DAOM BR117]|eukprot:XP_016610313.1 hypothetical protein SPPG_02753 [Spizellomyces punctatus DAOM BR117]
MISIRRCAAWRLKWPEGTPKTLTRSCSLHSAADSLSFITRDELAMKVTDPAQRCGLDYLIVDVREPWDYSRLHIRSAVNIPSPLMLTMPADALLDRLAAAAVRASGQQLDLTALPGQLIFHCTVSLVRGPTAAVRLIEILRTTRSIKDKPEISVLDGGFKSWAKAYANDRKLVEGSDAPSG